MAVTEVSRSADELFGLWYTAHESGATDDLAAVLAEDVEVRSLFRAQPVRTRAAAVAHFQATMSTFPDLSMPVLAGPLVADDGTVVAEVKFCGTFDGPLTWAGQSHAPTHRQFSVSGVVLLHTDDNFITEVRTLFDRDEWLTQIGVPSDRSAT